MRHFLHAFAVIGLVLFTSLGVGAGESAGEFQSFAYPAEGGEDESRRQYFLHLPSTLKANAPLLFVLHGYRGDPRDYMGEMEMNRQAEEYGFAVCYPQGIKDDEGVAHWNAGLKISKVDDVAFLSQLALDLQKKHGLDPNRTFACGVSNGGFMSYTLVVEKPDVFKAAASVIGTMSGDTWQHRANCKAVPILQMTGMEDKVVPHDGSMSKRGGWGGAPGQEEIIKFWSGLADAREEEVVELTPKTTVRYYRGGTTELKFGFIK